VGRDVLGGALALIGFVEGEFERRPSVSERHIAVAEKSR
jgi:hypothetical protein